METVFPLRHTQVLNFPMNNRRLYAIERKERQEEGVRTLGVDLQKINVVGRQMSEDIVEGDARNSRLP